MSQEFKFENGTLTGTLVAKGKTIKMEGIYNDNEVRYTTYWKASGLDSQDYDVVITSNGVGTYKSKDGRWTGKVEKFIPC